MTSMDFDSLPELPRSLSMDRPSINDTPPDIVDLIVAIVTPTGD